MLAGETAMLKATTLASLDGVRHGFFTRQGGVSGGIYASLNCGPGSRDDMDDVKENRRRVADALGVPADRLLTVYQQHSAKAVILEAPWDTDEVPQADAIVTATPGLAIGVLTADCAPVLLCDSTARVVGARRERIVAVIGPAISQKAYEVGTDYRDQFLAEEPESGAFFVEDDSSGEPHFDLPGYVAERLARAGVAAIADLGHCTYCDETRLFSYRRSQHHGDADYGRQISAILLT
jgi:copper oxidase (laccase) domain-containing protein